MKIVFLNRFYWPDEPATAQLLTDVAEGLAQRGREVEIITGPSAGAPAQEERNGVLIRRVQSTRWGRRSLAGRAVDFATFLSAAGKTLAGQTSRGDAVVAMTDPPALGIMAWRRTRGRGVRLFHWTQDIYPEIAIALGRAPGLGLALAPFRRARDRSWRESAGCVAVSRDMGATIASRGVSAPHISVIANWAPAGVERFEPAQVDAIRRSWGLDDRFIVAYSGNLGRVHELECLVRLAGAVRDEARIAVVFIGHGAQRQRLEALAASDGLRNVHFQPPQPRGQLGAALAAADLHAVTLRADCAGLVFPSKLYGIAAVGRPALAVAPRQSELAEIVRANGFGIAHEPGDVSGAASALRALAADPSRLAAMGAAAREFHRMAGGAARATGAWEKLLAGSS